MIRTYRIHNRVSGASLGDWEAESPEHAIAQMLEQAGAADGPSGELIAVEIERAWTSTSQRRRERLAQLAAIVGDDGTGDLGVIHDCADPDTSIAELAQVVRDAREDAAIERGRS